MAKRAVLSIVLVVVAPFALSPRADASNVSTRVNVCLKASSGFTMYNHTFDKHNGYVDRASYPTFNGAWTYRDLIPGSFTKVGREWQLTGFNADLLASVMGAAKLEYTARLYPTTTEALYALRTGECDLAFHIFTITAARQSCSQTPLVTGVPACTDPTNYSNGDGVGGRPSQPTKRA